MADEFQLGSGNWWDSTRSTRYDSGTTTPASATTLSTVESNYGWQTDIMDSKTRSSMESASVSGSSMVFTDPQKLQESSGGGLLADPTLQMMGLGLASHNMDWNPALYCGGRPEGGFRTMMQEEGTTSNFQQDDQWKHKLFGGSSDDSSTINDYKQINRGLSLDQPQYSSHGSSGNSPITCQGLNTNFQVDSTAYTNPTHTLQGFLVCENQQQPTFDDRSMKYGYPSSYSMHPPTSQLTPAWSKFPQFLRGSPPKQPLSHGQSHFSNNTPFWNASSTTTLSDARSSFFPPLQSPLPPSNFQEKDKNTSEIRDSAGTAKKNCGEASSKRARQETTPAMPAFKVRKEKMGDRITALQQIVCPFGKTDTASVLSEAIDYIKYLHEQVSVLSTPYMTRGGAIHHQQNPEKTNDPEGSKQDLRSRGLCLVPVSSTFPVTHETTIDLWTPTFGGTFR